MKNSLLPLLFAIIIFLFITPKLVFGQCSGDIDCSPTFCCRPSNTGLTGACYDLNTQLCCARAATYTICANKDAICGSATVGCINPAFTSASAIVSDREVRLSWIFNNSPNDYLVRISTSPLTTCPTGSIETDELSFTSTTESFSNYKSGGSYVNFNENTLYYYRIRARYTYGTNVCGTGSFKTAQPLWIGLINKLTISGVVFLDNGIGGGVANNGIKDGTEDCPNQLVTVSATDPSNRATQQSFTAWHPARQSPFGGPPDPAGCTSFRLSLSSNQQYTVRLNPVTGYRFYPNSYTVTVNSLNPSAGIISYDPATPTLPVALSSGSVINANFALQVPSIILLPWIQTTGGDVHSNTRIHTPGGP